MIDLRTQEFISFNEMRRRIGAQGGALGTDPQGSSCRKEGNGEERRVPGAPSGREGLPYLPAVVARVRRRGAH